MGCASVPQTKEQAVESANPPPGACNWLIVSRCALIWGHGGCCHGKRWQSLWRVGQWRLMLVVVCFVYFLFCVVFKRPFSYRRGRKLTSAKAKAKLPTLLCNHNIKITTKPPQCNYMSFKGIVHRKMTAPHIDMKLIVWGQIRCMKMVPGKARFS